MKNKTIATLLSYTIKSVYYVTIICLVLAYLSGHILAWLAFIGALMLALGLEIGRGVAGFGFFPDTHAVLVTLVAVFVLLVLLSLFLPAHSPLHFISSCSMFPQYQLGDGVLVWKSDVTAPLISLSTPWEYDGQVQILGPNISMRAKGSILAYCQAQPDQPPCQEFLSDPSLFNETTGPLTFHYGSCPTATLDGSAVPCLKTLEVEGQSVDLAVPNSVVVFPVSVIGGNSNNQLVAHRVMTILRQPDGQTLYLTKGDNNPLLDMQMYDSASNVQGRPVMMKEVQGVVVMRIPLIGWFSRSFLMSNPQGC